MCCRACILWSSRGLGKASTCLLGEKSLQVDILTKDRLDKWKGEFQQLRFVLISGPTETEEWGRGREGEYRE